MDVETTGVLAAQASMIFSLAPLPESTGTTATFGGSLENFVS
jgi:hypothetical protein